jgi:lysophospholipase L1-like esterase
MTSIAPMPKEAVQTTFLQKALLVVLSVILILLAVCAGELYCRWFTRINFLGISRGMFISRAFGDSYGNRPDYRGMAFGADVQTDANGFRIDPTFRGPTGGDAVLILGDSVSFGVGVDAAKTVPGLLQRAMPQVRFYNSSVIGYGLHDYANVVETFVPRKPEIKYVLLFYCLNDIYDTNAEQIVEEVNGTGSTPNPFSSPQAFASSTNAFLRSRSKLYSYLKTTLTDPSMRYFKQDLAEYQKRLSHIGDSLRPLRGVAKALAARGVTFEVFIMPYEAQVRTNEQSAFLPQTLVDDFLRKDGISYYDAAPAFVQSGLPSEQLYLYGDPMHLSEEGHRFIFQFAGVELTKMTQHRELAH